DYGGPLRRSWAACWLHNRSIARRYVRSACARIVGRKVRPQRARIVEGEARIDVLYTWNYRLKIVAVLRVREHRHDAGGPARVGMGRRRRARGAAVRGHEAALGRPKRTPGGRKQGAPRVEVGRSCGTRRA